MSPRQLMHVISFAVGRLIPMKSWAVPRGDTTLDKPDRVTGEIGRFRGTAASGQGNGHERGKKKDRPETPARLGDVRQAWENIEKVHQPLARLRFRLRLRRVEMNLCSILTSTSFFFRRCGLTQRNGAS